MHTNKGADVNLISLVIFDPETGKIDSSVIEEADVRTSAKNHRTCRTRWLQQ
jgi:hypothetical protein